MPAVVPVHKDLQTHDTIETQQRGGLPTNGYKQALDMHLLEALMYSAVLGIKDICHNFCP